MTTGEEIMEHAKAKLATHQDGNGDIHPSYLLGWLSEGVAELINDIEAGNEKSVQNTIRVMRGGKR